MTETTKYSLGRPRNAMKKMMTATGKRTKDLTVLSLRRIHRDDGGDCNASDARVHPGGSAVCGDDGDCDGWLLDPGEVCDDGNDIKWDGCTDCLYLEFQVNT